MKIHKREYMYFFFGLSQPFQTVLMILRECVKLIPIGTQVLIKLSV